jgi:serine protease Do
MFKKFFFGSHKYSFQFLILTVIISVVLGGLVGGLTGFLTSKFVRNDLPNVLSQLGLTGDDLNSDGLAANADSVVAAGQSALTTSKLSVEEVVEQASPAVVSVIVSKEVTQYNQTSYFPWEEFFGSNWPFNFSWPDQGDTSQSPETKKEQVGAGTGFVVASNGLVVTNKHVASDSTAEYSVVFADGTSYEAALLGTDPFNDVAILKIEGEDFPTVKLGDSNSVKIGETVVAIGNALGQYSNTVTTGIVSGLGRDIVAGGYGTSAEELEGVIQTDAAINPGNSGGPLLNLSGEVIGINTAVSQEGQLIGFAIPINTANRAISSVQKYGRIVRPFLGIRYVMVDEEIAKQNSLEVSYGALIARGETQTELAVMPGSPADKAGLVENDIILEVDGTKLEGTTTLTEVIAKYDPGDSIELKIYHRGDEKTVKVFLAEYKD